VRDLDKHPLQILQEEMLEIICRELIKRMIIDETKYDE
jgi:hypothetical protein